MYNFQQSLAYYSLLVGSLVVNLVACEQTDTPQVISIQDDSPFEVALPESTLDQDPLTAYPTEQEKLLAKQDAFDTRGNFQSIYGATRDPQQPTRAIAEFEATEGVLISWDWSQQDYILRLIQLVATSSKVWVLTANVNESRQLKSALVRSGVPADKLGFFEFKHESVWTRDYGPWSIINDEGLASMVDVKYFFNRRRDDAVPTLMARHFNVPVYRPALEIEGGNFMSDGAGRCFFSSRVLEANYAKDSRDLGDLFNRYLGCEQSLVLEPLIGEGTGHIDMFTKLLSPDTLILGYYRYEDDPMNAELMERNLRRIQNFAQQTSWPLKVIRMPMPRARYSGAYPSYTNSLMVNDLVIVPIYPRQNRYEAEALKAYQDALGAEYQIVTIDADQIIEMGGAVHCTTMGFVTTPNLVPSANGQATIPVQPSQPVVNEVFESTANMRIPESGNIQDRLQVSGLSEAYRYAVVNLNITHSFLGDLIIVLSDGERDVTLFNRENLNSNALQRNFTIELPANYNPNRSWALKISDREPRDEGTLISWSLTFKN